MNKFSRVRRGLILAAVLLTPLMSGAFVPPTTVSSKAAYRVYYAKEITYYSDASHTQVVGVGNIYCNGTSTLDGTSTRYRTEQITDVCCGSVPC
jgi:hypothetical protein